MNICVVLNGRLVTPPLQDTILDGITRRSLIELCEDMDIPVEERPIHIEEVIDAIDRNELTEMMGVGTAAVITPIGTLRYREGKLTVGDGQKGPLTKRLHEPLIGIQFGLLPDNRGWRQIVPRQHHRGVHFFLSAHAAQ